MCNDNITNDSANFIKSTQANSYTRFPAKPNDTHNASSKLCNDNITNHSDNLSKNTLYYSSAYIVKPDGTIVGKNTRDTLYNGNNQKSKPTKDCVLQ